jgi:hypothetical protein
VVFPFINQVTIDSILSTFIHSRITLIVAQLIFEYGITHGDVKKVGYYAGNIVSTL